MRLKFLFVQIYEIVGALCCCGKRALVFPHFLSEEIISECFKSRNSLKDRLSFDKNESKKESKKLTFLFPWTPSSNFLLSRFYKLNLVLSGGGNLCRLCMLCRIYLYCACLCSCYLVQIHIIFNILKKLNYF